MGLYYLVFFGIIIIPILASLYVNSTYKKYRRKKVKSGITGFEVARKILDSNGLKDIHIVEVGGTMSDHYDPSRKVVRLSSEVFHGDSVASVAIAAHECGHAIQDKDKYLFMRIRSLIVPLVNLTNYASYIFLIISFILSGAGMFSGSQTFIWIAIFCMMFGVLFHLVTLPVEVNASSRAKKQIKKLKLASENEQNGVFTMLFSAALTYVAGLVSSLLELLRLVLIARNMD